MTTEHSKSEILAQIQDLVVKNLLDVQPVVIEKFIASFYAERPCENLARIPLVQHCERLLNLWNFYQHRPLGIPKISVVYTAFTSVKKAKRLMIDIINTDMSFLVDSLNILLKKYGLTAHIFLHPVFAVRRDNCGNLIDFESTTLGVQSSDLESFIHCEVTDDITEQQILLIQNELPHILQEIKLVNADWPAMSERVDVAISDLQSLHKNQSDLETAELEKFLLWMKDNHFTFLGYCNYDLVSDQGRLLSQPLPRNALGILKLPELQDPKLLFQGINYNGITRRLMMQRTPFLINKASQISKVHRLVLMDTIGIKRFDNQGRPVGIHLFLGLFTSTAYDSSARDIPYLRQKVQAILKDAQLSSACHSGKSLVHVLDSLPRDELFQASVSELKNMGLQILQLQQLQRVSLFIRPDGFNRFVSCLVYIPSHRFTSELVDKIASILVKSFQGTLANVKAQFSALDIARIHYIVKADPKNIQNIDVPNLEQHLITAARSWRDELEDALQNASDSNYKKHLAARYENAFSQGYQERFKGCEVFDDIKMCEQVYASNEFMARVYQSASDATNYLFNLKIFNPQSSLALSDILPTLENLDTRVLSETCFRIQAKDQELAIWVHEFVLASRSNTILDLRMIGPLFLEALHQVFHKKIEDDGFNRLVLSAGLMWRETELMRAYFRFLKQLNITFSESTIQNTLIQNFEISRKLIQLFKLRFDPTCMINTDALQSEIDTLLQNVSASDDDRILRRYLNCILSTVRTNYFQKDMNGDFKSSIALKFESKHLEEIPLPRPLYEIFIYSRRVEAIHLRGGKVARGGIRWSDRNDDFRTEVLGLMKAQMVKNVVIIPVGSKGGFIIKSLSLAKSSRDEIQIEAIACYQIMIRGLLDITDNLIDQKCVIPPATVRYDTDDPYLVVAADKGTASFSDYANAISDEYGFWLSDAFASGGSDGYDHKKMAITARGAWEAVKHHGRSLGINPNVDRVTMVGVGDMSGDVFGNGLLLSNTICLIAAFNHTHIFIDPNPDPTISFNERQRLFNLPRSGWQDYNPEVLSQGGGVYNRSLKKIMLSEQAQQILKLSQTTVTPAAVIQAILKLNVDILWLGGIGTFIKSHIQSHIDANDRNNDAVRIDACDLNCRILAEGANVGVTHLGRIEFDRMKRGRINTDAIDNSAGVDTSDHEVNIKILLRQLEADRQIDRKKRNQLLYDMSDCVAQLVLRDNYLQNLCISLMERDGINHLDLDARLMRSLEKQEKLNRAIEFLPDDPKLEDYQTAQLGLTRPEIAVLMAYAKMSLFEEIISTSLIDAPWLEETLLQYFPKMLQEQYPQAILKHPLRREIIATSIVNRIVNRTGSSFIFEIQESTGCSFAEVLQAFLVVIHVFDFESLWSEIETYDFKLSHTVQLDFYFTLLTILKRTVKWLLRNRIYFNDYTQSARKLRRGLEFFIHDLHECLDAQAEEKLINSINGYHDMGVDKSFAERLALLGIAASSSDILLLADMTGFTIKEVAKIYYHVNNRFQIGRLKEDLHTFHTTSPWSRRVINGLQEDLYVCHNRLVHSVLDGTHGHDLLSQHAQLFESWIQNQIKSLKTYDGLLAECPSGQITELAVYTTLIRALKAMI